MTKRQGKGWASRAIAITLSLAVLIGASAGLAHAWWQATSSVTATATAIVVPPPTGATCRSETSGIISLQNYSAIVSWTPPADFTPSGYRLFLQTSSGAIQLADQPGTTTSVTLSDSSNSLMSDIADSMFGWITGDTTYDFQIYTLHSSGWMSSTPTTTRVTTKLNGVFTFSGWGYTCA
ncbi:MAG: hypothetical protein LBM23_00060 [Propionibacteriaceae bacterium]|jgi:hypothetical protein|nr:hypothetical protein [Propionibacteriaceae bacterium]